MFARCEKESVSNLKSYMFDILEQPETSLCSNVVLPPIL